MKKQENMEKLELKVFRGRAGYSNTSISVNESSEGELLINKVDRIVNNGEPLTDGTSLIYTERKDGVLPEYDIRTDRRDIAINAMSINAAARVNRREEGIKERQKKGLREDINLEEENGKTEPTDTTGKD